MKATVAGGCKDTRLVLQSEQAFISLGRGEQSYCGMCKMGLVSTSDDMSAGRHGRV